MSYWLKFYHMLLNILQKLLYMWVQSKVLTAPHPSITQDQDGKVCYILRTRSLADSLVLDKECKQLNLHRPFAPLSVPGTLEKRSLSFLINPGINPFKVFSKREQTSRIKRLLQSVQMHPELNILIVPVTVFWGRSPDKENSLWKIIFSDTWSIPGSFRKCLMILIHGRQTFVQFDEPISLRKITDATSTEEPAEKNDHLLSEISSLLNNRFKKQREAVIGPDLSHRRMLVQSLLDAKPVRKIIQNQASEKSADIKKLEKKALKYADEIASDYSYAVIRVYDRVLTWVWNNLYDGVNVHHIDELQKVAKDYEIIYVPSHRSHIDYLLLSYVLYSNGLVPPHIAAGINLNLPILGPILRRGGAFFMRRTFKDNPLYAAIFDEYMHTVLSRGFSIEYFIEGGRSRTGRLLPPRIGMLSMTIKSFIKNANRPIAFIPVYFGYERIFEGSSYIGELKGKKKEKEKLSSFFQIFRKIRRQFGKVHVSFSNPIYLHHFLDQTDAEWENIDTQAPESQQNIKKISSSLATKINTEINNAATVHAISILSTIILSTPKQSIAEDMLWTQIELYSSLLNRLLYSERQVATDMDPENIIAYGETMGSIYRKQHTLGDVLFCTEQQAILLSYFRNNTLHIFAIPALISLLVCNNLRITKKQLNEIVKVIYPFLKTELFIKPFSEDLLSKQINNICQFLIEKNIIQYNKGSAEFSCNNPGSEEFMKLKILGATIRPAMERYYIVLALLKKFGSETLTAKELENLGHLMTERMSLLHQFNAPEHFDRKLFRNFLDTLLTLKLIEETEETKQIKFGQPLIDLIKKAQYVLTIDLRYTILQITEDGSAKFESQ